MTLIRAIFEKRRLEEQRANRRTHVSDAQWLRSEELRPDRLGPGPDDISPQDETTEVPDTWRPRRTLGQSPKI